MIRTFLLAGSTLLLLILCVYSRSSAPPRADLTYVNPSGIHTLDPVRMSWTQDFRVALNLWEGLTTWDPITLAPIEAAAVLPPKISADRFVYTFTLRQTARWSNGDVVTAGDFVRGWRRAIEPGTSADYAFLLTDHIAGAADYVAWRSQAVARLTALKRLRDGWGVNLEQAQAVAGIAELSKAPPSDADVRRWIESLKVDWKRLYAETFAAHAAELDQRFAKVGVKALNDRTVEVRLSQSCSYFLDLLGLPVFLPAHRSIELLREHHQGAPLTAEGLVVYDPQWTKPGYHRNGYPGLITSGPYRLADWTFKRSLRLAINPFHRVAKTATCRTVDMLVVENVSAAIMAYEAGDVDFLPAMDVPYDHEIARRAQSGERTDFHLCPALATYFLNFNCVSESVSGVPNPFLDRRVRKAFALAVSRNDIVEQVLSRGDRVARSFVPPGAIPGYDPPQGLTQDIAEARRLLSESGHADGAGLPVIELLYTPSDERLCQALARMWEEALNVRMALRSRESKTFAEDKANHRFMIARGNWFADYNDPTTFLDCLAGGNGNNDSGYANPRYDALLRRADAASDTATRAALLRQAETIIVEDDFPILPILHYAIPIAIKPYVSGLHVNARLWFPFQHVRVDR